MVKNGAGKKRRCSRCKETKPLSKKYWRKKNNGKFMAMCKECTVERQRELYVSRGYRSQEAKRRRHLKRRFGISLEQYEDMFEKQRGRYFLCGKPPGPNDFGILDLDHCHKTKKIRKLLCRGCNLGLGGFRDNPTVLRRAAKYVEVFNGQHGRKI